MDVFLKMIPRSSPLHIAESKESRITDYKQVEQILFQN